MPGEKECARNFSEQFQDYCYTAYI